MSIQGRGRRGGAVSHLAARVDVLCERGHKVGMVWRDLQDDTLHVSRGTWTDTPNGGKVEWECERCGATPRARWSRIVEKLDQLQAESRHAGTFTP